MIFLPGVVAVLAPFLYGLKRYLYAHANYGPVAATTWSSPWFGLAAITLIPLIWLALQRVRRSHRIATLHKEGIMIRWTGGQFYNKRWEDIEALLCDTVKNKFLGIALKTRQQLTILSHSGEKIRIDDRIPNLSELTERIKAKIYPRLLPQLRAALQKGDLLYFGPVILQKQAIKLREQGIPWDQVTSLSVVSGKLVVESKSNRKIKIAVGKIPNVDLLIQLLQEGVHP
ncbi:MAG: hypothetical protein H8D34_31920 [Chloroflexi bacterium]|nr:hypothetical protein [Chloroflexota bacterium]